MRIVSEVDARNADRFTSCGLCWDKDFMKVETTLDGAVVSAIERHYKHAKEKHPYFCDWIGPDQRQKNDRDRVRRGLAKARQRLSDATERRCIGWDDLLNCEVWEVFDAIVKGDTAHAVDECHDAIAVLLRVIDVLEGRQALGRPKEVGAE